MQTINTNITTGLVVIVLALLGYLLLLSLRRPVLAKLGLRNIPRRPAQSILIVLGLTLSTIIIVSALSTGDTLSYSLRQQAVSAYGQIDEVIAPPLLSMLITLGDNAEPPAATNATADETTTTPAESAASTQNRDQINELMKGGLSSVLTILEGGLPGISSALPGAARRRGKEPLIDAVASSILFPTIIRNVSSGQGEPLGFVFAVDGDYDQSFGLTTVASEPVTMDALQPGIGNIFVQASNLFSLAQSQGQRLLGDNFSLSNVALATAALGSALTANRGEDGAAPAVDLAQLSIPLRTLQAVGVDTMLLEQQGITESLSLQTLGVTPAALQEMGVNTTTVALAAGNILPSNVQTTTAQLLGALNLNTLGAEIDRVLAEFGLQLRQGDLYLNQLGAEKLNAQPGDVLEIFVGPIPIPFRVKAIVAEAGPVGVLMPVVVMRLDEAQKLFFMHDKVNNVLISNQGDELSGLAQTTAVSERLKVLALDPVAVEKLAAILRRPAVRTVLDPAAARIVEQTTEEIGAPPIIANLVQTLANAQVYQEQIKALPTALDQPGITDQLRGVVANTEVRSWLTRLPLAEQDAADLKATLAALNQFDVIDPLNKATMLQAATAGGAIFTTVFSLFGIFSILAGVMLIFLIFVMMAAERRSEMGMARAIGVQRSHLVQMFVTEGVVYDLVAALFGVALGLGISYLMVGFLGGIFNNVSSQLGQQTVNFGAFFHFNFHVQPSSVLIAYCLGVLLTFGVVTVASWRVSHLNIVTAIRALPDESNAKTRPLLNKIWRWAFGPLLALLGYACWTAAWGDGYTNVLMAITLILAGLLILVERALEPTPRPAGSRPEGVQRLIFTLLGLGLLAIWTVPWDTLTGRAISVLEQSGPLFLAAFALRAPMIILGAILAIMFNADALTWLVSHLVGGISSLTPVLKTAIAYPLSTRFRTGMAMVMFAMIICTVVIMAVVIQATQALITLDVKQSAGFEITVSPTLLSVFDPITDLPARMATQTTADLSGVAAVSAVARESVAARQAAAGEIWESAQLDGVDPATRSKPPRSTTSEHAAGYADDAPIWDALRTRSDVAIVTPDLLTDATGPSARA
ncbi:MAG: FtsX-like permease family protein [Caldilineaceae bacterium]